jgi:hypothetical protein
MMFYIACSQANKHRIPFRQSMICGIYYSEAEVGHAPAGEDWMAV